MMELTPARELIQTDCRIKTNWYRMELTPARELIPFDEVMEAMETGWNLLPPGN